MSLPQDFTEFLHQMFPENTKLRPAWLLESKHLIVWGQFPCLLRWRMEDGYMLYLLHKEVCVCVCVCVCVSVVGQKHYLLKCSLEYRELDFFPLLAVVQKYNGHPIRKSLFLSPINLGKRHFISNFFLMT